MVYVIKDYSSGFNHVPFAAKLNPFGSGLVYSSWVAYVYGPGIPMAMALDASGAAYIVGSTDASYFPSTPGAFQETFQGYGWDGFAMKVNPSGTGIEWSTFLGASSSDFAETVALGPAGQVYVGGYTFSADFPLPGCFQAWGGGGGGWVVSLTPDGSALAFGTMLGGGVADLAVAPSGALYVVGGASPNMPTVDPLPDTGAGSFIARIDPTTPFAGASTIYLEADSNGVEVNETAGVVNLTVRRLCGSAGAASVSYQAESGTAVSGVNFAPTMGTLVFGAGDATPQTIQVPILDDQKLTCEEPLTFDLTLDPASLSGSAWLGNSRASIRIKDDTTVTVQKATFEIKDAQGGGGPAWEANTDAPWLSLDQTSGFGPSTVKVYVDISGLSVGEYTGHVMVTAPGSPNPHIVDVAVSILPANGYSPRSVPKGCPARQRQWSTSMIARGQGSRQTQRKAMHRPWLTLLLGALWLTGGSASAQVVEYYHLDGLGNVRAMTDASGNVTERHDYLPFGEECTTGPCAANPGVGAGQPRKFTGKERDTETGPRLLRRQILRIEDRAVHDRRPRLQLAREPARSAAMEPLRVRAEQPAPVHRSRTGASSPPLAEPLLAGQAVLCSRRFRAAMSGLRRRGERPRGRCLA